MGKTIISECGKYEWDEEKALKNIKKHGVIFSEILDVFNDPDLFEAYDYKHSHEEDRYFCIGCLNGILIITTFYTERSGRLRLISSRRANQIEEGIYHDSIKKNNR